MKKPILFGVAGLVLGILSSGAIAAYAVNGRQTGLMVAYGIRTQPTNPAVNPTATDSRDAMGTDQAASLKGKDR